MSLCDQLEHPGADRARIVDHLVIAVNSSRAAGAEVLFACIVPPDLDVGVGPTAVLTAAYFSELPGASVADLASFSAMGKHCALIEISPRAAATGTNAAAVEISAVYARLPEEGGVQTVGVLAVRGLGMAPAVTAALDSIFRVMCGHSSCLVHNAAAG
jgi:hypothetical protein